MAAQATKSYTRLAIAIVIAALVIGASIFATSYFARSTSSCEYGTADIGGTITCAFPASSTPTETQSSSSTSQVTSTTETQPTSPSQTTSSTQTTSACLAAPGQPQGAFFRVLYDSNSTPVPGASVVAIPTGSYGCSATQETFTTNSTEWYPLDYLNAASILIFVNYHGSDYNLTMKLGLSIWNCGTLYLPSGMTNETFSPETSCASTTTSTTSSPASSTTSTSTQSATINQTSTVTTIATYTSCSGCPGLIDYNFTISVAYIGSWSVDYMVYDNAGTPLGSMVTGSYSGTGDGTKTVTVVWANYQYLTLCATAQKLDGSDATLTVAVTGSNSTAAPYGSVTYCGGIGA